MQTAFILVLITAPSPETSQQIASALVSQKLAACVNILPGIRSLYAWKGALQQDDEHLLIVKSRLELFDALQTAVREIHPYEVPEIIALPVVAGAQSYLDWWQAETSDEP
jgi:periplasmic divalent cation tolerance protein